jgi:hypothetical protein
MHLPVAALGLAALVAACGMHPPPARLAVYNANPYPVTVQLRNAATPFTIDGCATAEFGWSDGRDSNFRDTGGPHGWIARSGILMTAPRSPVIPIPDEGPFSSPETTSYFLWLVSGDRAVWSYPRLLYPSVPPCTPSK